MRKIFLLAIMLTGCFAFANNFNPNVSLEINKETETFTQTDVLESPAGTCYVIVNGYDKEGELVFSVTYVFTNVSSDQCDAIADNIASQVQKNF